MLTKEEGDHRKLQIKKPLQSTQYYPPRKEKSCKSQAMTPPMVNGVFMIWGGENYGLCLQKKKCLKKMVLTLLFSQCLMAAKREIKRQKVTHRL